MNYTNYEANVVVKYKVKLMGWPHDKFVSPYNINTVDELRNLRDALRCRSCFWMGLSSREVMQYAKDREGRMAAGEVVGKKRKERSDKRSKKGLRNKPVVEEDDDEGDLAGGSVGEGPSKRRKVSASEKGQGKVKAKRAKGKANMAAKTAKKRKVPAQSARSQVPPSQELNSDSDSNNDE